MPEHGTRLYGGQDWEVLYLTAEDAIAEWAQWHTVCGDCGCTLELFEWTTHPPRHHLPSVDRVAEFLSEWAAECGDLVEEVSLHFDKAVKDPLVAPIIDLLLDQVAARVEGRMADQHVATHTVGWEDGEFKIIESRFVPEPSPRLRGAA